MDRESLLDLARSLVSELESDDDQPNPNDVSNVAEALRAAQSELERLSSEVRDLRYETIDDLPSKAESLEGEIDLVASDLRDHADTVEEWAR